MSNINAIFLEGRATGPFEGVMVCRENPKTKHSEITK